MNCPNPIRVRTYPVDAFGVKSRRPVFTFVPCGKCIVCLSRRKSDWIFRLKQELKQSFSSYFVTLTYSPDFLPVNSFVIPVLVKSHLQKFMKVLRSRFTGANIRFFGVGEYGSKTLRPHYHLLLFNVPYHADLHDVIFKSWKFGHIQIGTVQDSSISYVCKYVLGGTLLPELSTLFDEYDVPKPFMLCSRRPAIGYGYISESTIKYHHDNSTVYTVQDGKRVPLPRYLRRKIFDEDTLRNINSELQSSSLESARLSFEHYSKLYGSEKATSLERDAFEDFRRKALKSFKLNRDL